MYVCVRVFFWEREGEGARAYVNIEKLTKYEIMSSYYLLQFGFYLPLLSLDGKNHFSHQFRAIYYPITF